MKRTVFALMVLLTAVCSAEESVQFSAALLEGDPVPGAGAVQFIDNLAINDNGDWVVECNTDFADTDQDSVLVRNGDVFLREGIVGGIDAPANAFIDIFDSVNINNNGNSGINLFIDPLPISEDSGVYLNDMLFIQESNNSTATGLTPGTPFIGFFDTKINNNDEIMIMASVDDSAIASSVDRAIVLLDTSTADQSVVVIEGDVLAGQTETVDDFATGPHASAFNDNGDVMFIAELSGSTTSDNAIYINEDLIAQEGFASPLKGRTYEFIADRSLDLNNEGEYVFKANLSGDSTDDDVLIKNGEVFKQEGDEAPGGFSFTEFGSTSGPIHIGDNGKVLWYGEWDDPDTESNHGLFVNDTLVVQSGVTEINGLVVDSVRDVQDGFAMSSNGNWIIFEATLEGGIDGAFIMQLAIIGDINGDGVVDLLDVSPFVFLVSGGAYQVEADINCDGVVDLLDVSPFVDLLVGT